MSRHTERPDSDGPPVAQNDSSMQDDDGTTRRRLLAGSAATWATASVAGCGGGDGDTTTSPGSDQGSTATDTPTETETTTNAEPQPENYVVTAETWAGGEGVPASIGFVSACATTNTFVPGMQVVFFVGVFDPATGDKLGSDTLDGVTVNVGDGTQTVDLSWSDENGFATEGEGSNWVGSWTIPEDIEPQDLSYTIEVSGGDGNFENVGVLTDSIAVVAFDDPTNLIVDTETRWNGHPAPDYTNGFVGACAPERHYSSEMDVTFVVGVYDSTNGHLVGSDGLYQYAAEPPEDGLQVDDETSPYNDGIDGVTVVSPDDAFDDIELEWTDAADDENGFPRWFATLETEDLDPGTYSYEVQVTDETTGRIETGIAADNFTIVEI